MFQTNLCHYVFVYITLVGLMELSCPDAMKTFCPQRLIIVEFLISHYWTWWNSQQIFCTCSIKFTNQSNGYPSSVSTVLTEAQFTCVNDGARKHLQVREDYDNILRHLLKYTCKKWCKVPCILRVECIHLYQKMPGGGGSTQILVLYTCMTKVFKTYPNRDFNCPGKTTPK